MSKPTRATLKAFIRKNREALHIRVQSSFNSSTDGVEHDRDAGFKPAQDSEWGYTENTLGIAGIWLVGGGRDYIQTYSEGGWFGYSVSNCCGSWTVAVKA